MLPRSSLAVLVLTLALSATPSLFGAGYTEGPPPTEIPGGPPVVDLDLIVPGDIYHMGTTPIGGSIKRIVPGFMSSDSLMDFMIHDGSSAALLFGAEVFSCSWHAPAPVLDLAGYRVEGEMRNSHLAVVSSTGLSSWTYDSEGAVASTPLGSSAWAGARSLQTGLCDAGALADVVGISSTDQILVLSDAETSPTTELAFSCPSTPVDLILVDWDVDGLEEIVVRAANGLHIFEADGTPVTYIRGFHPEGALTKVPVVGGSDWIAWVTRGPTGATELLVLLNSQAAGMTFVLGTPQTEAISAGDLDADGFPDLALRQGSDGDLLLLRHTGTGYAPDDPNYAQLIPGVAGDGATGKPLFVDLDGDGDLDLFWGVSGGSWMRSLRSSVIDDAQFSPDLGETRFDLDDTTGQAYLKFLFSNGETIPEGLTHLQCTIFRKNSIQGTTSSVPTGTLTVPIQLAPAPPPETPGQQGMTNPNPVGGGGVSSPYDPWQVPLVETNLDFPAIYAVVLRYVALETQGTESVVVESSPSRVLLFTTETQFDLGTQPTLDYLSSMSQSQNWFGVTADVPPPPPGTALDLASVGTLITTKPVPDLEDDEEPDFSSSAGS